jgi:fructose-1,6-bisphosphatase/inositol monophosphatase family enzyme
MGHQQEYSQLLAHFRRIGDQAGEILRRYFALGVQQEWKPGEKFGTVVTAADREIHELVRREAANAPVPVAVDGEEGQMHVVHSAYTYKVDEVDGTALLASGLPLSVFSIAAVDKDGRVVVGLVEEPLGMLRRRYWAIIGGKSYMQVGDNAPLPLRVNTDQLGPKARIDAEWWPDAPDGYDFMPALHAFCRETGTYTLTIGSVIAALMTVARGGFAACMFAGASPDKDVDSAAAGVILRGAGATVTDFFGNEDLRYNGGPIRGLLATNGQPGAHETLLGVCRPTL